MPPLDFAGKLVVVTGASSGLGREIALSLALDQKAHVLLAARRRDRLEALKAEIESRSASRAYVLVVDLADAGAADTLYRCATAIGDVEAVVACAGMTFYGPTLEAPPETCRRILVVNQLSVMEAVLLFLPYFLKRGSGGLLTVTSVYGLVPGPYQNVYAASKHAVQTFMEGLAGEYRGRGVTISTFAAGSMVTEMIQQAGLVRRHGTHPVVFLDPARTARAAIASFKRGRIIAVPGALYKVILLIARFLPRRLSIWLAERVMRP
jgi:short-subunit dehydrogenase